MDNPIEIGLYFGSFNPVHKGHISLADYITKHSSIQEVWFIVSPQNPFKMASELADSEHRLQMLQLSISSYKNLKVCDIELNLPTPSYTYKTLRELRAKYPNNHFSVIMGADNLPFLHRWKNADEILNQHSFIIYPRPGYTIDSKYIKENIETIDAPIFDYDSTSIREKIKLGESFDEVIPQGAYNYICDHKLYL